MKIAFILIAPLVLTLALAGCDETASQNAAPSVCPAESYQDLIGSTEQEALDTLVDLFLLRDSQPEVRYINQEQTVDMFFRPERMNIVLNSSGTVTQVYCG